MAAEGGGVMGASPMRVRVSSAPDDTFRRRLRFVRGEADTPGGAAGACVSVPADTPDIEAAARPLLAAEFAAGRWFLLDAVGDGVYYLDGRYMGPTREPLAVA